MPQLQAIWNKFNSRERLSVIGAGLLILGWLVGITTIYGIGSSTLSLLGAIAVVAVLYLKYANPAMVWPAPVSLIVLAISGVVGLIELLHLLTWLGILGGLGAGLLIVSLGLSVAGAAVMLWGAWQEYQVEKPPLPAWLSNMTSGAATNTAPPPAAPPAPAAPAAPAAPSADSTDEAPPA